MVKDNQHPPQGGMGGVAPIHWQIYNALTHSVLGFFKAKLTTFLYISKTLGVGWPMPPLDTSLVTNNHKQDNDVSPVVRLWKIDGTSGVTESLLDVGGGGGGKRTASL